MFKYFGTSPLTSNFLCDIIFIAAVTKFNNMEIYMKIKDSEYILNSVVGKNFETLSKLERDVLFHLDVAMNKAITVNEYNPKLDNSITQIVKFEGPDLLIISSGVIYAIEHFQIDSSETTMKGSSYKNTKNYHINEVNKKIITKLEKGKIAVVSDVVNTQFNYKFLIDNLKLNFENHYSKISQYEENIIKLGITDREVKFLFFIQYDLIFPSVVFEENSQKMKFVFPHNDINCIEYFKRFNKLTGIFFDYDSNSYNFKSVKKFLLIDNNNY